MMKRSIKILALLGVVSTGQAQEVKDPAEIGNTRGVGTPIADNTYDGTLASMTCLTTPVTGGAVQDVSVDIAMNHTWIGDLTIKVVSPMGTVNTVMSRPGLAEVSDGGMAECCGDSSDLVDTSAINFSAAGAIDAENMGANILGGEFVCQDDGECNFLPNPGVAVGGPLDTFFDGEPASGNWQVCVGDGAAGDVGDVVTATANVTAAPLGFAAPEPIPTLNVWGMALFAGLALVGGGIYLRRREMS